MIPVPAHASPAAHDIDTGSPWPLGVTAEAGGCNVAVWAPEASRVLLCLYDERGSETRIPLPRRTGGVWHARVGGIGPGTHYGFRAEGPAPEFNPQKLLIDPYARELDRPLRWHPLMRGLPVPDASESVADAPIAATGEHDADPPYWQRDSAPAVPKCIVQGPATGPDPRSNRPRHPFEELVIYETHLKGLTASHPGIPAELRGTYAGLAHPVMLRHLVGLGVNAVELLPLQAFLDDQHLVGRGLRNYWGYQPIAMLAPEPRYAGIETDADRELRALVHALHEAGIEVILDVVFNHSGEGDAEGPTLSFRGLHDAGYYLRDERGDYVNDTGTGNTLAVREPMVLRLVLDSLRHWALRYGIDGFRFDLAAAMGRTEHGFDPHAAFFQAVAQDPVLGDLKLIAEPWDLGPGGYRLGEFPSPWREWNDRFRDGTRRLWKGESAGLSELGALLLGSAELFDRNDRPASSSVNLLTAHDGFTLADAVAYSQKHNEANGEGGRDGHDANHSDNLGVEGATDDPSILAARARRARGMLATLLLAQGTPMLLAGDELGNSQLGNNNAYAQDNALGWVDWGAEQDGLVADTGLLETVQHLIALRRRLPHLRQAAFLHGGIREDGYPDAVWLLPDGSEPNEQHWNDPGCRTMSLRLRGASGDPDGEQLEGSVLIIFTFGEDTEVCLPETSSSTGWTLEMDTARIDGSDLERGGIIRSDRCRALAQSVVVCSEGLATAAPGVNEARS